MRRLWGRANSVNVQKAIWGLEELGLPYERIDAGGAHGVVGEESYRALNPNGLVPTLQEDDFVLWESNAILRYLARLPGSSLALPDEPRSCARVDQWLDWQTTTFTPAMRDCFWQLIRVAEDQRDRPAIEASRARSEAAAALLDSHLAGTAFVAGDTFGIADIAVGCAAHRWLHLPIPRKERPNLARWYRTIAQRRAAVVVVSEPMS
ncbi:glutathione S-transferase family protein [Methylobacterium haplocladii]|uniref:Glutathione S-transferase n=1 Tax=Methylobacterium haplocladii TaxID=1176176 RepID=A0A512IKX8_9HYPH|nr:glutathione S-transferase family protein [Methylobacterium haplocladii]GEO98302.1 glutathione S-transferase [Methylobacterium haplocladii]GJD86388.1 Glutathione S-transferase GstB [Methylobacterium haplocladii]GLS58404.1 glutathione S-transferase [Methylobacterium haplocladii]